MRTLFLSIIFIASTSFGATRYYLPISGSAAVTPALHGYWTNTSSAVSIRMVAAKSNTALTDQSIIVSHASQTLYKQYVSDPIGVVNFNSTTFKGVIRGSANSSLCFSGYAVYLYHAGGTVDSLVTSGDFGNQWPASAATVLSGPTTLNNITSANNDRIVCEIGADNQSSANRTTVERFGDPSATADFAFTGGLTTDLVPWIEFSATIPAPAIGHTSNFFNLFGWLRWNFGDLMRYHPGFAGRLH